jgi:hypothetical protein
LVRKLLDVFESFCDAAHELLEKEFLEFSVWVDSRQGALLDHPFQVVCEFVQDFLREIVVV